MWGEELIRRLGLRLGDANHSLEFRHTNIPSRGSLLLVDDTTNEIIVNDNAFGIYWNFPCLYHVWKYEERKDKR